MFIKTGAKSQLPVLHYTTLFICNLRTRSQTLIQRVLIPVSSQNSI